jgi:hypothetical protein
MPWLGQTRAPLLFKGLSPSLTPHQTKNNDKTKNTSYDFHTLLGKAGVVPFISRSNKGKIRTIRTNLNSYRVQSRTGYELLERRDWPIFKAPAEATTEAYF